MQRRAALAQLIEKLQEQRGPCMRSGRSISIDSSSEIMLKTGKLSHGRIQHKAESNLSNFLLDPYEAFGNILKRFRKGLCFKMRALSLGIWDGTSKR
jgi:hypothetical protein